MRRGLAALVVVVLTGLSAAGADAAGGNSNAALACQQSGYLSIYAANGSSFKNTGDCVSYFAHGGTGCTVTSTNGCLIFANAKLPDGSNGNTVTINAAFSIDTACNPCYPNYPNSDAVGGGTYVVTDPSGHIVASGTLTADNTQNTLEGLATAYYADTNGNPITCSAASQSSSSLSEVALYASDSNVPGSASAGSIGGYVELDEFAGTDTISVVANNEGFSAPLAGSGVTFAC